MTWDGRYFVTIKQGGKIRRQDARKPIQGSYTVLATDNGMQGAEHYRKMLADLRKREKGMNITEKEYALIQKIVLHNEYGERGCLDNHPWSWAVCGDKATAAVLGSLVKKGLAHQEGRGNDASCYLTEAGKTAYVEKFGSEGTWRNS